MLDHFRSALEIIYPLSCGGCGSSGAVICPNCTDLFRRVEDSAACPVCGRWVANGSICGACIDSPVCFERGYYGFYFEGPLREALLAFKFEGRKDVGRRLMRLLEEKVKSMCDEFDAIIPLPVTEKRLNERGFNQCYIVAEEISAMTGRPIIPSVLCKKKETKDQFTLSREDRAKNIRGAFAVSDKAKMRGKRILLVDDLLTTGHTAMEASQIILSAHAQSVLFFALARTP